MLDLGYNKISDITPLAQLTQLTSLNLINNKISDLTPLAHLRHLGTIEAGFFQGPASKIPLIKVTSSQLLVEARLNGSSVTLTLLRDGTSYDVSTDNIRNALTVSGIDGVSVSDITRVSDTEIITVLEFTGNFDTITTLTFAIEAEAILGFESRALTGKIKVYPEGGPTIIASTSRPLTGATLDDAKVTLTLSSGAFPYPGRNIENAFAISGMPGIGIVEVETNYSDRTKMSITLDFNGDIIATDTILTLTVESRAMVNYNGPPLTVQIPVKGVTEAELAELSQAMIASTPYPLTEATLNGSVVTLKLPSESHSFQSSNYAIGQRVKVSGIKGVTIARGWVIRYGDGSRSSSNLVRKFSDTEIAVELRFSGRIDKDATLIFTVEPDAVVPYNGPPLTAEISVSATTEVEPTGDLVASTAFPLTKATLDDSMVVLTLQNRSYAYKADEYDDILGYDDFRYIGISGIHDVQTADSYDSRYDNGDVIRLSSSEILVRIDFQGDFNTDVTLTFTVPPSIIENYDGPPLTAKLPVTIETELRVLIPELQEQPMFWVNTQTGKIGSSEYFDAITNEVTVLTVDRTSEKLYWGERSKSGGVIKRADFNGTNVEALVTLSSVPRGIVVDAVRNKMYWTNSDLQIQTATLEGEEISTVIQLEEDILEETKRSCSSGGIFWLLVIPLSYGGGCDTETVRINLTSPTDIAVNTADGRLYWTEFSGRIRRVNLDGTGLDTLMSDIGSPYGITIADGKIYWAEEIDKNSGKIQRANPNGTNVETLATVQGLPTGISVDTEAGKVYWANSLGGIQRMDINNGEVEAVVSGISSPGDFVLVPSVQPATTTDSVSIPAWDVNADGKVNRTDLVIISENFKLVRFPNKRADVNGDGTVDIDDLIIVAEHFGEGESADSAAPASIVQPPNIVPKVVQTWLILARITDDGSLRFQRGIANLEALLASIIPVETTLLANYPNPFNPETWIPYQLAKDADVTLHIYAVNGVLVRTLTLGHQPAGMYQSRSRAAYWDGKNEFGEPVASGVYFYTLSTESTRDSVTAGDFTATRKMLIRK